MPMEEQVASIFAGTQGYLDGIGTDQVTDFEESFLAHMRNDHGDVLATIRDTQKLEDDVAEKLTSILDDFSKTFA